jgi:transcription antitermination factor NusG
VDWYALYTKHQHEKSAATLLEKKGIEQFLPLYRAVHRWKDRNQQVLLPLLPCYLFVRAELRRKLEVLQTAGIRWFVENAGRACPIPEFEIEALQKVCSSGVHVAPCPFLKKGDTVRLKAGPLLGIEGILTQVKNEHRIVLSVDLLQRSIAVEVDLASVEPVKSARSVPPDVGLAKRRIQ